MKEQANNSVGLSRLLLPSTIGISLLSTFNSSYELFQYYFTFLCSLLLTGYPRLISRGLVPTFCMHDTLGHRATFWPPQPKAPVAPPDWYVCEPDGGYIFI
jgi:hypothetical protein